MTKFLLTDSATTTDSEQNQVWLIPTNHVFKNMLFVVFHFIGHTGGARVLTLVCAWAATATSRKPQPPSCQLLSTGGPGLAS